MPAGSADPSQPEKVWTPGRVLQLVFFLLLMFGGMFVAAGTWRWLRGWIYTVTVLGLYAVVTDAVRRKNPTLLPARAHMHFREMKPFDRVFILLMIPVYTVQPIVAALDAVRFRWTSMPFVTVYPGVALVVIGMLITTWAMLVNPFAETTVRIQRERGQSTVTTGPYRYVRHPMYAGVLLVFPAAGLVFGSWWAVVIGLALDVAFVWRTVNEERLLLRELPGYKEYAETTRYRLIPGVW